VTVEAELIDRSERILRRIVMGHCSLCHISVGLQNAFELMNLDPIFARR
jgi:hypothetical protein